MKHLFLSLLALLALIPVSAQGKPALPPGLTDEEKTLSVGQAGPVNGTTTEAELVKRFGKKNVKSAEISLVESETAPGTILFPDDPALSMEIVWTDEKKRANPSLVRVSGEHSLWTTTEGVTIGSTLVEVQKINGKPFILNGMGWDMGGGVSDWQGGSLASYVQPEMGVVQLGFDYPPEEVKLTEKESESISGERQVSSSFPALKKLNPIVTSIIVSFVTGGVDH